MRWETNYTDDDKIMEDFVSLIDTENVKDNEQTLHDMKNYLDQYRSQFIERENPSKEKRIKWLYKILTEIAFVNSGHVILEIDEEKRTATLKYMGKSLYKTLEENDNTGLIFALIFYSFDFVSIDNGKEYFTTTIYENLFDKIKVNDNGTELDRIRNGMYKRNREKYVSGE